MKKCLNCRKSYEDNLTRCPFCGYRPRTKTKRDKMGDTQEFDTLQDITSKTQKEKAKNIKSTASHTGAFYLQSGEKLNSRYSVINVMGFGSFGVAYECFDTNTRSNVVVKEFFPSYIANRSRRGRDIEPLSEQTEAAFEIGVDSFLDENKKLLDNDVRCVPSMRDCFKENNTSYVVTELVEGEALSSVIRRKGRLPYQAVVSIITGVLQGLRQLNKLGIIHGDICPDNIIVTNDSDVYLLDYNLSDFNKNVYTQRDTGKLRAGYSALELYYLNMEQGPWTDVYAAAAVMYKMLTGITVPSAIKRKTNDSLTSPSKLGVPITVGAEKAMLKALRVDYEKRTKNPEDFLNGLTGDGFDNVSIAKQTYSTPSRNTKNRTDYIEERSSGSGKILSGILVFLIIAIIGVVIWLFISGVFTISGTNIDKKDSDTSSRNTSSSITDTDVNSKYNGDFYSRESSDEETDTDTEKDTDTHGFIDGIISRIIKDLETDTTSSEEYHEESSEESYEETDSSTEEYYEEDPYDNTPSEEYYESEPEPESVPEEGADSDFSVSGIIDGFRSEIENFINQQ